jgi:hypothetical protein
MSQTASLQTLLGKSPEQSTVWRDKGYGASWAKCPGFRRRSPKGSPRSRAITRMLGPLIVYTDLNDLRLLATFGAWEMMARLTARRSLVSPMIKKDFLNLLTTAWPQWYYGFYGKIASIEYEGTTVESAHEPTSGRRDTRNR